MRKLGAFAGCVAVCFAAGAIGSAASIPNISTWYAHLAKPWFNPPNWVFGPVWTLLYILMAVSLYVVWLQKTKHSKRAAYSAFGAQLILNAAWSLIFFGAHSLYGAVAIIGALWAAIVVTILLFWRIRQAAAYLLVPYLAWVSFAAALTIAVTLLNA